MKNSANKWVIVRSTNGVSEPRYRNILLQLAHFKIVVDQITWERNSKAKFETSQRMLNQFYLNTPFGRGKRNFFNHLLFQIHIWRRLQSMAPDVVYSCDLDTFLVSAVWAKFHHRKVVFDQFDPISSRFCGGLQKIFDLIEDKISRLADLRISANGDRNRNKDLWVELPNYFPFEVSNAPTTPTDNLLFYGGVLQPDRGLMKVAEFLGTVANWKFSVFGDGPDFDGLSKLANRYPNVEIHRPIEHDNLMILAKQSAILLALYDPTKSHNQFTSSNKLYEAAQLEVPVIATKGTQIGKSVEEFKLGWTIEFNSVSNLASIFAERSRWTQIDLVNFQSRCKEFLDECNYDKLLNNYRGSIAHLVV